MPWSVNWSSLCIREFIGNSLSQIACCESVEGASFGCVGRLSLACLVFYPALDFFHEVSGGDIKCITQFEKQSDARAVPT